MGGDPILNRGEVCILKEQDDQVWNTSLLLSLGGRAACILSLSPVVYVVSLLAWPCHLLMTAFSYERLAEGTDRGSSFFSRRSRKVFEGAAQISYLALERKQATTLWAPEGRLLVLELADRKHSLQNIPLRLPVYYVKDETSGACST